MNEPPSLPFGFSLASSSIGLRETRDAVLVTMRDGATASALFTKNSFPAAPILVNREHLSRSETVRALLINAVFANACTGTAGLASAKRCAEITAESLDCAVEEVLVFSTGKIGPPLPLEKFERGIPLLAAKPDDDIGGFARAILTTDTVEKIACVRCGEATILGFAKGSGMICPDMATMLAFVLTDARIEKEWLDGAWKEICDETFNRISVDSCESTNDAAVVLASQKIPVSETEFRQALFTATESLAMQIARDGEGATMLLTCHVAGAASKAEATTMARRIVSSNLVKCAAHGHDPNWGRVMSAMGSLHENVDPRTVRVSLNETIVWDRGSAPPIDAKEIFREPDLVITVDLGRGVAEALSWGCDLSHAYVDINAHYKT
ncbi:bifunctional glutamate N-acetyltransferase/amino-acid acetyltransferase ArgJ [Candidatus Peregrinibacteria bacterium]|nr:bifunctional glutamate N-acetyltransferase/amino-acid acetyltransferase ArgJ [Candidatus Peregrinibacteria bacterium]MBI3816960.1 bifunctional glutamate N-acetyltransferase/amino-acid acetyltransferase ArgJ [Candidatus Peregrinibacteria bacterium]